MIQQSIPVAPATELRFSPVLFGPDAPAVRVEWWSTASGGPRYTGKHIVVAAALVGKLADELRRAAAESMQGPVFAPAIEESR